MLSSKYFIRTNYERDSELTFNKFRFYIRSLDSYRNSRLKENRVSITADLLIQRSIINNKNYKEKLIDADLFLYYISTFKPNTNKDSQRGYSSSFDSIPSISYHIKPEDICSFA